MRPRGLSEFVGQRHIMAPGRLLRRAIEADRLSSLIFYGPPGTGKTTLAEVIAQHTSAHFHAINAVLAGVKDLRLAIDEARRRRGEHGQQTVLFIDEVHRFNKAQQDALLPWVERGTVILIGATTENPYFEVNKALVSRSRVFQLRPLEEEDLDQILQHALEDADRGYGSLDVILTRDARQHLINVANGDARALLGALELGVETTEPDHKGRVLINLAVAEESIQRRAVLYDKEGDAHFDTISAFIKSMRGSDPDASLYWLARMVYAGEDPRFILRRLLIFASEDVGLACPEAVSVVLACAQAFDRMGMPEGRYPLAQATLYLANAPKSNSTMGFFDALASVEREREGDVPTHLKDGSRDSKNFGHGKGYLYPHAWRDHWVAQQYLPDGLQGRLFYQPSMQGQEAHIHEQVHRRRDAQLAAMVEREALGDGPREVLTYTPDDPAFDRWVQRAMGDVGQQLAQQRDRIMQGLHLERHHLVLDLMAGTGLLTWEAARQVPEGGVWARCPEERQAQALEQRAQTLPELRQPHVLHGSLLALPQALRQHTPALRLDAIVGRGALLHEPDKAAALEALVPLLQPGTGRLSLMESLPRHTQRLWALLPQGEIPEDLLAAWRQAEEQIYADPEQPMLNWTVDELLESLRALGLEAQAQVQEQSARRRITAAQVERWFQHRDQQPCYAQRLLQHGLDAAQVATVQALMRRHLQDEIVPWGSAVVFLQARRTGEAP